jgi:negative regulator of replication initiation
MDEIITKKQIMNGYRNMKNPSEKKLAASVLENIGVDPIQLNDELTGSGVNGFRFAGKEYKAESHIDVLRKVLKIVFRENTHNFDEIITITGKKNTYFSKNSNDLRRPERIGGTNIYFETNENAQSICVRCEKVLKNFKMDYTSFEIMYYK